MFVSQPACRVGNNGTAFTFSTLAAGTDPVSYQWLKDGVPIVDGDNVAGTSTPVMTLTNVPWEEAMGFSVVVSNQSGCVTSAIVLVALDSVSLDASFNPGSDSYVNAIAPQPDGKILVGGIFRPCVARHATVLPGLMLTAVSIPAIIHGPAIVWRR